MDETEISKKISVKIKNAMREKEITFGKMSTISGIPTSTLHDQLKKLTEGNFIQIKYLLFFEKILKIKIVFFEN